MLGFVSIYERKRKHEGRAGRPQTGLFCAQLVQQQSWLTKIVPLNEQVSWSNLKTKAGVWMGAGHTCSTEEGTELLLRAPANLPVACSLRREAVVTRALDSCGHSLWTVHHWGRQEILHIEAEINKRSTTHLPILAPLEKPSVPTLLESLDTIATRPGSGK